MKYEVTRVYTYTTTVVVEADSKAEAIKLAYFVDSEINNKDALHTSFAVELKDD